MAAEYDVRVDGPLFAKEELGAVHNFEASTGCIMWAESLMNVLIAPR